MPRQQLIRDIYDTTKEPISGCKSACSEKRAAGNLPRETYTQLFYPLLMKKFLVVGL